MIGGRFGEWFEAPSYEEGVGVDGKIRGQALGWGLGVSPTGQRPDEKKDWGYPPKKKLPAQMNVQRVLKG